MPPRYGGPPPAGARTWTGGGDAPRSAMPEPRCPTSGSPATCPCSGRSSGWWTNPSTGRALPVGAVVPASGLPKAEVVAAAALVGGRLRRGADQPRRRHRALHRHLAGGAAAGRALADAAGGVGPAARAAGRAGGEGADRRRAAALAGVATRPPAVGADDGALLMSALIGGYVPRAR